MKLKAYDLRKFLWLLLVFLMPACGGTNSDPLNTDSTQPLVIATVPVSAQAGEVVQVQGVGFTPSFNQNIIFVAGTSAIATSYSLVADPAAANGATDQIEFTLPANATVGESELYVLVGQTPSNSITFTVESP